MLIPAPGSTHADAVADAARAMDPSVPLTFMRHLSDDDVYHRGPEIGGTLYVIPGLWTTMRPALIAALRARRRASVTGRCAECDAVLGLAEGRMCHEPGCPVTDENLRPLVAVWARQVGTYARGRRILEDPA